MKVRYENYDVYCMKSENTGSARNCVHMSPLTVHPQCIYIELLGWDLEWLCTNAKLGDEEVGQSSGIIFKNIVNMIQIEK